MWQQSALEGKLVSKDKNKGLEDKIQYVVKPLVHLAVKREVVSTPLHRQSSMLYFVSHYCLYLIPKLYK